MKRVQSLWIGDRLSRVEFLCARSFLHHGHSFHLYAYHPVANVPDGVMLHDANDILPESAIYKSDGGRLSSFANFFRWKLLNKKGGLWVDMDMICLKPFDFDGDIIFGLQDEAIINNAVLGFPKGHFMTVVMGKACDDVNLFQPIDTPKSIAKKILRRALFGQEKSRAKTRFTEPGGPDYFTKFLAHYELSAYAKPVRWFYPVASNKAHEIFTPHDNPQSLVEDSYAIHLWNAALGNEIKAGVDDQTRFKGTLFADLCARYL